MVYAPLADGASAAIAAALAGDVAGVAVATSGTSGSPRIVHLSRRALRASAEAALERLGGPGEWLLALPDDRIGGANVLARAEVAGTAPVRIAAGSFTAAAFVEAAREVGGRPGRRYVSLVPTQLTRVLADPAAAAELARFDAVLVGGAALNVRDRPANVVASYGMTETCGGCVFDGQPLDGVEVAIAQDGRIYVAGDVLADGFADGDDSGFVTMAGRRWFATPDVGEEDGGVRVIGRADHVIITGAHKVHPAAVEAALEALDAVSHAAVTGVPDDEWGQRVVALAVPAGDARPGTEEVRAALSATLPRHALPREVRWVDSLPLLPTGKIDRMTLRESAAKGGTRG